MTALSDSTMGMQMRDRLVPLRRSLAFDSSVAALATAIQLAHCATIVPLLSVGNARERLEQELDLLMLALAFLSAACLVARRRAPVLVLAVSAVSASVYLALGYPLFRPLVPVIALLTVALTSSTLVTAIAGAALALGLNIAIVIPLGWFQEDLEDRVMENVLLISLACLLGWGVQLGRARTAALREQAARLSFERTAQERALQEEKSRIARELHDVVAHHISVITAQAAGAQRVFDARPELARQALDAIEMTGRGALVEMRRLLGLLQAQPEGALLDPQPTLAQLPTLLARTERAGLPVRLSVSGSPSALPPGMELNLFRIVQEALTNTLKHAGPARASVELVYGRENVSARITDDGRGFAPGAHDGRGLLGMRERAALHGGDVVVGPGPDGGVEVLATLPLEHHAEAGADSDPRGDAPADGRRERVASR